MCVCVGGDGEGFRCREVYTPTVTRVEEGLPAPLQQHLLLLVSVLVFQYEELGAEQLQKLLNDNVQKGPKL